MNCDKKRSRKYASRTQMRAILFARHLGENMPDEDLAQSSARLWSMILTDVHFWVPAIVLLAGLAVLRWIR